MPPYLEFVSEGDQGVFVFIMFRLSIVFGKDDWCTFVYKKRVLWLSTVYIE